MVDFRRLFDSAKSATPAQPRRTMASRNSAPSKDRVSADQRRRAGSGTFSLRVMPANQRSSPENPRTASFAELGSRGVLMPRQAWRPIGTLVALISAARSPAPRGCRPWHPRQGSSAPRTLVQRRPVGLYQTGVGHLLHHRAEPLGRPDGDCPPRRRTEGRTDVRRGRSPCNGWRLPSARAETAGVTEVPSNTRDFPWDC